MYCDYVCEVNGNNEYSNTETIYNNIDLTYSRIRINNLSYNITIPYTCRSKEKKGEFTG
jgi:hypothetical protein